MAVQERRRKAIERKSSFGRVTLITEPGTRFAARVEGLLINRSETGICVEVDKALPIGMLVQVEMRTEKGDAEQWEGSICWMTAAPAPTSGAGSYRAGVEARANTRQAVAAVESDDDLYEVLQVNPKADFDTIHRIYRMLAQRFHPDHKETGDAEKFQRLLNAYQVVSDPEKRAGYDVKRESARQRTWQVFGKNQGDGVVAEKRKRVQILAVLYRKRLRSPEAPHVVVREFEDVLGIEKEHMEFALWYLREKGYLQRTDNGRYLITAAGVDASEASEQGEQRERLALKGEVSPVVS
jgi:curved DNA-binding protein